MALKATIHKAELQIADMDRNYYASHELTLARHPSETDERMMLRLLAFALHASEELAFGRGLSTEDEPDLWETRADGRILTWIDLGQPEERRIRKACGRADAVWIYTYNARSTEVWWPKQQEALQRFANLGIRSIPEPAVQALAGLARRNMQLQCSIQDGQIWFGDEAQSLAIEPLLRKAPGEGG
ncbi:YaeQ family protein [Thiohalobacter sp. IOR34]|uniref:YaeQ family protein n=1 Tax=Thiohalobacter sp. IOR34 TaxID=3057176 RepID=UPI0025B0FF70|nr:YaeQ family protein [Thiohalobacter sp. IOR34]WJW76396.1 YaeQ family protein [Thiohalobacter sp. IOR34]